MKKFAFLATMLAFAIAVLLLPAATMAAAPNVTLSITSANLGTITLGQKVAVNLVLHNSGTASADFTGVIENPNTGNVEVRVNVVGYPTLTSTTPRSEFFPSQGIPSIAANGNLSATVYIRPLVTGVLSGSVDIEQSTGDYDPSFTYSVTVKPTPPPPPPPGISFFYEFSVEGDSASVGLFLNWNTIWLKTGSAVLDLGDGRTVQGQNVRVKLPLGANTIKATAIDERDGKTYTDTQVLMFSAPVAPPPPPQPAAVIPAEPDTAKSSTMAVSGEKAGGKSEKRKGGYWGKAGKPLVGVQSESWGRIKNQRIE
ncbi:MAG: hypothetical protein AAB835_00755 [Patescibacteria group bacterium]